MNKRIIVFLSILALILPFSIFSCDKKEADIKEWDLNVIGYNTKWDKKLSKESFKLGIIDFSSIIYSDDQKHYANHSDTLIAVIEKLTDKCNYELILLEETDSIDELIHAIEKMIDQGIRVINLSMGTTNEFKLSEKINSAIAEDNLLLICSAGNLSNKILYPAKFENVISVISRDIYGENDKNIKDQNAKKSFSMPGNHVYLLDNYYSGSSISTMYVSVAFAALKAKYPSETNNELIIRAQRVSIGSKSLYDYGTIQFDLLLK